MGALVDLAVPAGWQDEALLVAPVVLAAQAVLTACAVGA